MRICCKSIIIVAGFLLSLFSLINVADGHGLVYWILLLLGMVVFYIGARAME
jgi:hypothetical protein